MSEKDNIYVNRDGEILNKMTPENRHRFQDLIEKHHIASPQDSQKPETGEYCQTCRWNSEHYNRDHTCGECPYRNRTLEEYAEYMYEKHGGRPCEHVWGTFRQCQKCGTRATPAEGEQGECVCGNCVSITHEAPRRYCTNPKGEHFNQIIYATQRSCDQLRFATPDSAGEGRLESPEERSRASLVQGINDAAEVIRTLTAENARLRETIDEYGRNESCNHALWIEAEAKCALMRDVVEAVKAYLSIYPFRECKKGSASYRLDETLTALDTAQDREGAGE